MKKLLLTITTLLATATMSAFDSGGLSFTVIDSEKNECAVTGYDAATIPTSLDIPAKVADNGITYTVVRIDRNAFKEAPITSLTVPSTVTTIQSRAFYCKSLQTIDLPVGLEKADRAFFGCTSLTTAYIRCKNEPDGWSFGLSLNQIFYFGSVQALNSNSVSSTVQYIHCLGNTPPEITYTNKFSYGFDGIVLVPSSAVADYRAADVWKDCRIYSNDAIEKGFTFMIIDAEKHECQAVHYDKFLGGDVVIPSIVAINGADYTVTGIAVKTFYNCNKITSLTIPATVREIGEKFLGYNPRLERITVEDDSRYYKDIDGILYTADGATLLKCPEHYFDPVAVPDGVRTIAELAFNSSKITSVVLPNTLNEICYAAFSWCEHLTKVTIPASVTTLERSVFMGCYYLKYAKIESEVVGENMFYDCKSLSTIILGPKVKKLGKWAFRVHNGYSTIYVLATTPPQCEGELSDDTNDIANFTLKVPYESKDAYTNDAIWGKVSTIENTLGSDNNGLTYDSKIYGGSFCGAIYADPQKAVGDFVIPGQVTIGGTTYDVRATFHNIFDDNPKLTSLTMPNSMDMISKAIAPGSINISQYKSNSKYYGFSDGILSYGINSPWITACIPGKEGNVTINRDFVYDYAFYGCDKIASLSFENTVTLGQHAFDGCKGLEKIDVNIGGSFFADAANFVFANCTGLKKATIKSNEISIGAFANCKSLEEVTIEPHNPEYSLLIYNHVFFGCPSLKSIICRTTKPYSPSDLFGLNVDILESYRYQDVTLYVPTGSAQAYKEHGLWKKFGNIVEKDMGGVDDVFANDDNSVSVFVSAGTIHINGAEADAAVAVYDLAGRTAYSGTSKEIALGHHGIYIVAVAGKTFKVAL